MLMGLGSLIGYGNFMMAALNLYLKKKISLVYKCYYLIIILCNMR
jgi:hypothetical protein